MRTPHQFSLLPALTYRLLHTLAEPSCLSSQFHSSNAFAYSLPLFPSQWLTDSLSSFNSLTFSSSFCHSFAPATQTPSSLPPFFPIIPSLTQPLSLATFLTPNLSPELAILFIILPLPHMLSNAFFSVRRMPSTLIHWCIFFFYCPLVFRKASSCFFEVGHSARAPTERSCFLPLWLTHFREFIPLICLTVTFWQRRHWICYYRSVFYLKLLRLPPLVLFVSHASPAELIWGPFLPTAKLSAPLLSSSTHILVSLVALRESSHHPAK